jgi:hypothetical protein
MVQASELEHSLLKSERPSSLAQAIIDLGRLNKTIYLLNYIDDEGYRRRILTQLNRGEGRHKVARTICHGRRGEIRKAYREGQEDQLGALGLVTNAVVSGIRFTCRRHWSICSLKAWTSIRKTGLGSRPSSRNTSMCSGVTPLPWPIPLQVGTYGHSTPKGGMRRLSATFRSNDCRIPILLFLL